MLGSRGQALALVVVISLVVFLAVGVLYPRLRPPLPHSDAWELPSRPGSAQVVPRNLFTYWSGPPDHLAEKCMARMRAVNPDWNFARLDGAPVEPCEGLDRLSVQALSDWVRVCALEKHGGVWLDATVVCVRPLEAWVDLGLDNLQGFTAWHPKILESWALAAPPRHPLVSAWKAELRRAIGMGFDAYKRRAPAAARLHGLRFSLPYLTAYACYRVAAEETGLAARTTPARDGPIAFSATGPLAFRTRLAGRALKLERAPGRPPPLIKINGFLRGALPRLPCVEGSLWAGLGLCVLPLEPRTRAHDLRDAAVGVVAGWFSLFMDFAQALGPRVP